jgi:hypothetical protein
LRERLELDLRLLPFSEQRWDGSPLPFPVLHLDDLSALPNLGRIRGIEEYQHRARLRAREGDLFAAVTLPTEGYEDYCRERLGLSEVEFLHAEEADGPMAVARACTSGRAWQRILQRARDAGGMAIHPFMGNEDVWELAGRLAGASRVQVTVIAPPPPATWIANDKALFSEVVELVLGKKWLLETHRAADAGTLANLLLDLAGRYQKVALKRLRCVSSRGNAVFDSQRLRRAGLAVTEQEVRDFLAWTEWQGDEEVLAVAWEEADVSPSTQLWIPPLGAGPPRLDGIYEQILVGEKKVFVGCRPSALPRAVNEALTSASLEVAAGLQALAYVGRCSFDFVVLGDPGGDFQIYFTECNGRWGGTSTPMALLDRLLGSPRPPHRAQDFVEPRLIRVSFQELLERIGDQIFDAPSARGRYIFYNTGPLTEFGMFDVIALGRTQEEAEAAMEEDLPHLLGV